LCVSCCRVCRASTSARWLHPAARSDQNSHSLFHNHH
jgi:hypothetical protein